MFNTNVQKDIVSEADRLDIKDKSVLVLCELLFDENILQQIESYRVLFLRVSIESLSISDISKTWLDLSKKYFA